ncbi:MAG: methylated-DNA--[protein]-cysteine S-methyltransferase [Bacteroides sp.]|nr:methylated-DNA--[protein]-cysteine S-methyltransferase [Bacteroides sp.]
MNMDKIITQIYSSPCGMLALGSFGDELCLCDWLSGAHHRFGVDRLSRLLNVESAEGSSTVIEAAIRQLEEYFAGVRRCFDVPLLHVGTDFQKMVWHGLLAVPYGKTISYGEVAAMLGRHNSVRAVANANGANPLSIFVPCHRVIGSDGSLTGYGGGLKVKEYLLRLEGAITDTPSIF